MRQSVKAFVGAVALAAAGVAAGGCSSSDYPQVQQLFRMRDTGETREITVAEAPDSLMEFLNTAAPDATIETVEERYYGADNRYYKVWLTTASGEQRVLNYNAHDYPAGMEPGTAVMGQ